ncbi:MAG: hypothetical protein FWD61_07015 [Phycisphaerales bacterium]|nr:hypothetical protein [Phycisphaerales bacterium]
MRPRTPSILWLPFVFSIGTLSWVMLLAGLLLLASVVLVPAYKGVCDAKNTRYDIQATVDLLDQKIAMQKEFIEAAGKEPMLMERLASRQLNLYRKDQEFLILDPQTLLKDRSVDTLLAESLTPVTPQQPKAIPHPFDLLLNPAMRVSVTVLACAAMATSFFLGVKYERR